MLDGLVWFQRWNQLLNVLYTFLHLYHHLVELGVGLRQFSDVAVLLKTHYNLIDKKKFFAWLDALDFRKAFDVVQFDIGKYFGVWMKNMHYHHYLMIRIL